MEFLHKLRRKLSDVCDVWELLMGVVVVMGILIATMGLWPELLKFWQSRGDANAFMAFLEPVSLVVIGIEFAKMLFRPSTANIIEALTFLIARQMIIDHQSPGNTLLSVIAICILFTFRRVMLATKPDSSHHHVPNIVKALKIAQTKEFREAMDRLEPEEQEEKTKVVPENEDIDNFWVD